MSDECKVLERVSVAGRDLVLLDVSREDFPNEWFRIRWGDDESDDLFEFSNSICFNRERMLSWLRALFFVTVLHFQAGVPLMVCEDEYDFDEHED